MKEFGSQGTGDKAAYVVAVDSADNTYVTGFITSTDFHTTDAIPNHLACPSGYTNGSTATPSVKAAAKIAKVSQLMDCNQAAFQQLAIAQIPIRVERVANNDGSVISQRFAVVMQDADSAEMRDDDGHNDGYVFINSHSADATDHQKDDADQ